MVEIIKQLCDKRKTTIKALEEAVNLGNGTIRRWDKSSPSVDKLLRVAQYFGVSLDYLVGDEAPTAPINETETRLLSAWRQADEKARKHVAVELEDYGFSYTAREKEAV